MNAPPDATRVLMIADALSLNVMCTGTDNMYSVMMRNGFAQMDADSLVCIMYKKWLALGNPIIVSDKPYEKLVFMSEFFMDEWKRANNYSEEE